MRSIPFSTTLVTAAVFALACTSPAFATSDVATANTTSTITKTTKTKEGKTVKIVDNKKCPISGEPVGSMQKGAHVDYNGYRVGLCCNSCKEKFMEDPDKYLEKARNE